MNFEHEHHQNHRLLCHRLGGTLVSPGWVGVVGVTFGQSERQHRESSRLANTTVIDVGRVGKGHHAGTDFDRVRLDRGVGPGRMCQ